MLACVEKYTLCQAFSPLSSQNKKKKDLTQIYTDLTWEEFLTYIKQVYMIVLATYCINR